MGSNLTTMGKSLYRWRLMQRFKGGHRFFLDEHSGRIGVADASGSTPDTTDDGVLWLPEQPGIVRITERLSASFPVVKEGVDGVYSTSGTLDEGFWVAELRGWRIMIGETEVQRVSRVG